MSKRLLKLRRIQQEKLERSRSWYWGEIAAGRFPKPVVDDLWDESAVDAAIAAYIERLRTAGKRVNNARAATGKRDATKARSEPRAE